MRLFFALWPDADAAATLADLARELAAPLAGKPVPREKIHLTLAFLGEVPDAGLDRAIGAGDSTRAAAHRIVLDHVGSFRRAKVAWAGSDVVPAGLQALHRSLASALQQRGFVLEERDFAPHVTLARRISRALARAQLPRTIEWDVEGFSLVRSETGTGKYASVASWDLAPP